jgi:hypothetical protein
MLATTAYPGWQQPQQQTLRYFVLGSLLVHILLLSAYLLLRSPPRGAPAAPVLSVDLQPAAPPPAAVKPETTTRIPPAANAKPQPAEKLKPATNRAQDIWQQGVDSARLLMQQPDFRQEYLAKPPLIPNYRNDLFVPPPLTTATVESHRNLATGETELVFRYPNGKAICVRTKAPDPSVQFDTGYWLVQSHCP